MKEKSRQKRLRLLAEAKKKPAKSFAAKVK